MVLDLGCRPNETVFILWVPASVHGLQQPFRPTIDGGKEPAPSDRGRLLISIILFSDGFLGFFPAEDEIRSLRTGIGLWLQLVLLSPGSFEFIS